MNESFARGTRQLVLLALLLLIPFSGALARGGRGGKGGGIKGISVGGIVTTDAPGEAKLGYNPVEGVNCTIDGSTISEKEREKDKKHEKYQCTSDDKGFFHFDDLPKGDYTITFAKTGYGPITKDVKVDNEGFPANIRVIMNPAGFSAMGDTPTGPGTVYVAFAERQDSVIRNGGDGNGMMLSNHQTMIQAIAAGADPLTLGGNAPVEVNAKELEQNGISTDPNTLMVYPPSAPARTGYQKLQIHPFWVCFNRTGTTLYVSSMQQMIQVLDASRSNKLVANIPTRGPIADMTTSVGGKWVLAAIIGNNGIMLIDTNSNLPTNILPCALPPRSAAMYGRHVYAVEGDSSSGQLEVLDAVTGASQRKVRVGANPTGIAITPDGKRIFVVNSSSASVSVIDGTTLAEITRIPVGVDPMKVAVSPDGQRAFVTNKGSDTVSMISVPSLSVQATSAVGKGPIGVAVSFDSKKVFVGCKDAGTVMMLDGTTGQVLHTTLPQPHSSPYGVTIRP